MRYDLIISGETFESQRVAVEAAHENRLVAVVRTSPFPESLFHFPLESWNWNGRQSWTTMKQQFRLHEQKISQLYAQEGIDLIEGHSLTVNQDSISLSTRHGQLLELQSEEFLDAGVSNIVLPSWLHSEVPHVTPLTQVTRLGMLPESIMVEGNTLPAFRFAVMCARLHRNVVISSSGWNLPEFQFELAELEDEANERGILRLNQQNMLSVAESPGGEFDFCLVTGDIYRTGLYVFATETTIPQHSINDAHRQFSPNLQAWRETFPSTVF